MVKLYKISKLCSTYCIYFLIITNNNISVSDWKVYFKINKTISYITYTQFKQIYSYPWPNYFLLSVSIICMAGHLHSGQNYSFSFMYIFFFVQHIGCISLRSIGQGVYLIHFSCPCICML